MIDVIERNLQENFASFRVLPGAVLTESERLVSIRCPLQLTFTNGLTIPVAAGPIDWNSDSVISSDVPANLLGFDFFGQPLPLQVLTGFDDWAHVQQFVNTPAYKTGQVRRGPAVP